MCHCCVTDVSLFWNSYCCVTAVSPLCFWRVPVELLLCYCCVTVVLLMCPCCVCAVYCCAAAVLLILIRPIRTLVVGQKFAPSIPLCRQCDSSPHECHPSWFISFSTVLLHVSLGRPLLLLPSGAHVSAVLEMLPGRALSIANVSFV